MSDRLGLGQLAGRAAAVAVVEVVVGGDQEPQIMLVALDPDRGVHVDHLDRLFEPVHVHFLALRKNSRQARPSGYSVLLPATQVMYSGSWRQMDSMLECS